MKIMIRARQKMKKFCFTFCYCDEDVERRGYNLGFRAAKHKGHVKAF